MLETGCLMDVHAVQDITGISKCSCDPCRFHMSNCPTNDPFFSLVQTKMS